MNVRSVPKPDFFKTSLSLQLLKLNLNLDFYNVKSKIPELLGTILFSFPELCAFP